MHLKNFLSDSESDFLKYGDHWFRGTNSLPISHWKPNSFRQAFGFSRAAEFFALCQGPKVPVFCFDWVHIHLLLRSNKQIMKFVPFGGNLKYLTKTLAEHLLRGRLFVLGNTCSRSPSIWVSGHWGTEPGGHRARHGWQCVCIWV